VGRSSRPERGKWSLSAGHVGCVSREKYAVKGYVVVLDDLEGEA